MNLDIENSVPADVLTVQRLRRLQMRHWKHGTLWSLNRLRRFLERLERKRLNASFYRAKYGKK